MEAKELRIGNYVKDHLDRVQKVSETRSDAYICYLSNGTKLKYKLNTTKPIPLTEDWLLKFGFEEKCSIKNRFINRADFELEFQGDKVAYCVWGGEDAPHLTQFFGHCKYVHQLQNLYFALTGEELTIKQ